MTDDAPAPLNTDLNGLIDHLKWMYFAQSQPLAWLHYRLAELAGTGKLDPEANRELQHELAEISQAIWREPTASWSAMNTSPRTRRGPTAALQETARPIHLRRWLQ